MSRAGASIKIFDEIALAKNGITRSDIIDLALYPERPLQKIALEVTKCEGAGSVNFTYEVSSDGRSFVTPTGAVTIKDGHSRASGFHGVIPTDTLAFSGVVGMTDINSETGTVASTAAATVTTDIDSSGFGAYVSGGVLTPGGDSTRSCVISGITQANPAVATVYKGRDSYEATIKYGRFLRIIVTEANVNTITALTAHLDIM